MIEAYVDGKRMPKDYILQPNQKLEFVKDRGSKGQDWWSKREIKQMFGLTEQEWRVQEPLLNAKVVDGEMVVAERDVQRLVTRLQMGAGSRADGGEINNSDAKDAPFVIDFNLFAIRSRGNVCKLRNTKPFQLFVRLAKSPGLPIPVGRLIDEIWPKAMIAKNTVQKTVSSLNRALRDAGMEHLVVDGKEYWDCYILIVK